MTKVFEVETTIGRPADEVWAALTDWANASRWMRGVDSMTAHGPNTAGTRLTFRARGKDRSSMIADIDPGRFITLRSVQGGVIADYRYRLEPLNGDSTRVNLDAECSTTGLWSLVGFILRPVMRRTDSGQLEDLKAMMEAEPPHRST